MAVTSASPPVDGDRADDRVIWLGTVEPTSRRCVLCGNTDQNVVFMRARHTDPAVGFLDVASCGGCESAWFPDFDEVGVEYPSDLSIVETSYFQLHVDHYLEVVGGLDWKILLAERLPFDRCSSMLEIGCNVGKFLDYCRTMWDVDVVGLEPSAYGIAGAEVLDLPILQRYMADADEISGRTFDFVCATEVLEHVDDPRSFMRELRSFVAPGGIAMLTTPRPGSLDASTPRGELLAALSTGAHRFLVSAQKLQELALDAGFGWCHIEPFGMTQVAYLAEKPIELSAHPDAVRRTATYHARRAAVGEPADDGRRAARRLLGDQLNAYVGLRACGDVPDLELEQRIERDLEALFGVSLDRLDEVIASHRHCENFIEFGDDIPYRLPAFLFWRGQRDDKTETERTALWEASALLAALGMRADPVNLFVYVDTLRPAVQALAGRVGGEFRGELIEVLNGLPEAANIVLVPPTMSTRAQAAVRSLLRRVRHGRMTS